jgi:hypothetical protein
MRPQEPSRFPRDALPPAKPFPYSRQSAESNPFSSGGLFCRKKKYPDISVKPFAERLKKSERDIIL